MGTAQKNSMTQTELGADLRAAVAARREMGADMEDQVLDVFLARVQQRIDAQVAQGLASRSSAKPAKRERIDSALPVMVASLGISIPLMAIAGEAAGGAGVFIVMAAVVLINTLYFIDRWVRFNLK